MTPCVELECRGNYEVVLLRDLDANDLTIDDLVSFAPAPPQVTGQPAGLGVVGMPINVLVDAVPHTASGELFDIPLTIRFSPVSFRFDYGDGTVRETSTPGRRWSTQFTATPTGHTYTERGTYTVRTDVRYRAELDIGRGWFPVDGLLTLRAADYSVRILEVRTALVADTCDEDPGGPGC